MLGLNGAEMMDYIVGTDRMILESILERSLSKWVNPVNVNRALGLDETEFGDRLMHLEAGVAKISCLVLGFVEALDPS